MNPYFTFPKEPNPYRSKVKEYTFERYVISEDEKQVLDFKYLYKLNAEGEVVESHSFSLKNTLADITKFTYSNGILTDFISRSVKGRIKQKYHSNIELLDNGAYRKVSTTLGDTLLIDYDQNHNPVKEAWVLPDKTLRVIWHYFYIYDTNGNILEQKTLGPSGEIWDFVKYNYNQEGLLVEKDRTDFNKPEDISSYRQTYAYNDKHDMVFSSDNSRHPRTNHYDIHYDERGSIIEIKDFVKIGDSSDFKLASVKKYSYVYVDP